MNKILSILSSASRILARMSYWRKRAMKCFIVLRSGEGLTSFN